MTISQNRLDYITLAGKEWKAIADQLDELGNSMLIYLNPAEMDENELIQILNLDLPECRFLWKVRQYYRWIQAEKKFNSINLSGR